ncbi:MAG: DoxX family protein [Candidatus Baltobacteraceae bacterium]
MRRLRGAALVLLGAFFIAAGALHFLKLPTYARIVPPWLPAHVLLVQMSGVCEILGGIGVLLPRTRRAAGIGLIALLIAVFPANLFMATHSATFADLAPAPVLWLRLPLQIVAIAWVSWLCLRR